MGGSNLGPSLKGPSRHLLDVTEESFSQDGKSIGYCTSSEYLNTTLMVFLADEREIPMSYPCSFSTERDISMGCGRQTLCRCHTVCSICCWKLCNVDIELHLHDTTAKLILPASPHDVYSYSNNNNVIVGNSVNSQQGENVLLLNLTLTAK